MKIIGTGRAVPKLTVTNDMLSEFLDTSEEWIVPRTGIHTRQIITDETLQELTCAAAVQTVEDSGLKPEEIDFIICSNVANNYITPAMSAFIQEATGCKCPFFDINGACAGFIYAIDIAEAFMQSRRVNNVLIVAAEEVTKFCDWTQRETCVLFGDGAAAAVVQKDDKPCYTILTGDSKHRDCITYMRQMERTPYEKEGVATHQPMIMKGRDVFRLAVLSSPRDLRALTAKAGITLNDVDFFLLHQANKRIIDAIRENLELPEEKFPSIIDHTGNASSASIPLLIDEMARQGRFKKGDVLALSAFGAGFVTAAAILTWGK